MGGLIVTGAVGSILGLFVLLYQWLKKRTFFISPKNRPQKETNRQEPRTEDGPPSDSQSAASR